MHNVLIAFIFTIIAGLSTIIGGLIILWSKKFCQKYLALALGFSAGIMVYVALDELLPTARKLQHRHLGLIGMIIGMIIMAISLYLLK